MKLEPIGTIQSVYKEKFGIPRQAGLVREANAVLKLKPGPGHKMKLALRGLDGFSHLWVIFAFHQSRGWNPLVRPPRLGGSRKVGTFASRSPHRPNPIGLSAVELVRIDVDARGGPELTVRGGDFLDGTPLLDLKPYIPYADSFPRARMGWVELGGSRRKVRFSATASRILGKGDRLLVRKILSLDPRPAFQTSGRADYSMRMGRYDIHWETREDGFLVTSVDELS